MKTTFLPAALALLALWLTACAPRAVITAPTPPPPPPAAPAAPAAAALRQDLAQADKQAVALGLAAKESTRAATAARQEAERLHLAKTATEAELTSLWKSLQAVEARNLFLEAESANLATALTAAIVKAAELETAATSKDHEAEELRRHNAHLKATAERYAAGIAETDRHRTRADRLAGEIRIYRYALVLAAIILTGFIAAKLFLPPRILFP